MEYTESPLFLQLDTVGTHTELPIRIFEVDSTGQFVSLPYKTVALPAEGIAVNHVSKNTSTGEDAAARRTPGYFFFSFSGHSCVYPFIFCSKLYSSGAFVWLA